MLSPAAMAVIAVRMGLDRMLLTAAMSADAATQQMSAARKRCAAAELLADLERARQDNDNVTELQIESDLAMITGRINEAIGIGGRLKQAGNKRKNISDGFRSNVKRVINRQIRETDPALAKHLDESILFGYTPRYIPKPGITWETTPVRNE